MNEYDSQFHVAYEKLALSSAREILTLLGQVIQPQSVIDVGCGVAFWLSVCQQMGIDDVMGIDGDDVDRSLLRIPPARFIGADLVKPLPIDREFDLVLCLEVAEHLAPELADGFVKSLTRLGKVVLFSAAIPGQGGVHHVNEQWQDFWAAKFAAHGYVAVDVIRPQVWTNEKVSKVYAQNMMLYVQESKLESLPKWKSIAASDPARPLAMVHPQVYTNRIAAAASTTFLRSFKMLPGLFLAAVRRRIRV